MSCKIIPIALFIVLLFGCRNSNTKSVSKAYIQLEKTGCMGTCPVYKLTLFQDNAMLVGMDHIEFIGQFEASVTNSEISDFIESKELIVADEEYISTNMSDLPTTYLRIFDGSDLKSIMIYGDTPEELIPILDYMESNLSSLSWRKIDE